MRRDRTVLMLVVLTAGIEVLGFSYLTLLPSLARDVLGVGAAGLGAMTASRSLGGMVGIAAFARLGRPPRAGHLFLGTLAVLGAALVLLGLTRRASVGVFAPSPAGGDDHAERCLLSESHSIGRAKRVSWSCGRALGACCREWTYRPDAGGIVGVPLRGSDGLHR